MDSENPLHLSDFPEVVPLLPMRGVILMPRMVLPVPVLDPAQGIILASCLQAEKKYIGLVQPLNTLFDTNILAPLFSTGCLAEIQEFGQAKNELLVAVLKGICRFEVVEELAPSQGCRQARVSYAAYEGDVSGPVEVAIDRDRLLRSLKPYLTSNDLKANWKALEKVSNDQLLNILSVACPFPVREKQALLETRSPQEQSRLMAALMEMAVMNPKPHGETCH